MAKPRHPHPGPLPGGYCETCDGYAVGLVKLLRVLVAGETLARPIDEPALVHALSVLLHEHLPGYLTSADVAPAREERPT